MYNPEIPIPAADANDFETACEKYEVTIVGKKESKNGVLWYSLSASSISQFIWVGREYERLNSIPKKKT